ncbi:1286_t:CDS:1, partial [Rhizophagus irregularis]
RMELQKLIHFYSAILVISREVVASVSEYYNSCNNTKDDDNTNFYGIWLLK